MNHEALYPVLYLAGLAFVLWRLLRTRSRSGRLLVAGKYYDYRLGDNLPAEYVEATGAILKFKGIDITLSKKLPHIYLDSHSDSRISGPRFYIKKHQRISLEGNFDTYFQLYVAKGYEQLALSIITPDVMSVLLDQSSKFDVEIKGTHLRLISQKNVFGRRKREAQIQEASKHVVQEIAHRLSSWNPKETDRLDDSQLQVVHEQSVKIFKTKIRIAYGLCLFIGLLFSGSWLITVSSDANRSGHQTMSVAGKIAGVLAIIVIPFIVLFVIEFWAKHSPKTFKKIFHQ